MNYPSVSVIITTYNRLEYLKRVLPHYKEVTKYPNYKLTVCDDCSTDGTKDWLLENSYLLDTMFLSKANLGVTNSRNQGIMLTKADYYALVDDDTIHVEGWLTEAINILESFKDIGAVTTQRPLWELLEEPMRLSALDEQLIENNNVKAMLIKYIGSSMVFSHDIWKKIGPMSHTEKRSGICRYSHRITQRGYKVARTYPPKSESIDMPQHKYSLRFSSYNETYTSKVAPLDMQTIQHYEKGINECKEFDLTHCIDKNGKIISKQID